jgi:glucokinase
MSGTLLLGWDIGGTKSSAVLGTGQGEILGREQWATGETVGYKSMLLRFEQALMRLLAVGSAIPEHTISALGVSMPGPMNMYSGEVLSPPHLPGWENVPLRSLLEDLLKKLKICVPVVVLHDAAACLLAEARWGAANGLSHAIYLTCGTGFGSGILINNRLLIGPHGESPEVGFISVADQGPSMLFGGRTRVAAAEIYGAGSGLEQLAAFRYPDSKGPGIDDLWSCAAIAQSAANGDPRACAVLRESALRVGQICVNLAAIFAPQAILIGSLARYLPEFWLQEIRDYFAAQHLPSNSGHTRIEPAQLAERLQDLSALAAAEYRL